MYGLPAIGFLVHILEPGLGLLNPYRLRVARGCSLVLGCLSIVNAIACAVFFVAWELVHVRYGYFSRTMPGAVLPGFVLSCLLGFELLKASWRRNALANDNIPK